MITEIYYQYGSEVAVYRVTDHPVKKDWMTGVKWIEFHDGRELYEVMLHDGRMRYLNPAFVIEYTVA